MAIYTGAGAASLQPMTRSSCGKAVSLKAGKEGGSGPACGTGVVEQPGFTFGQPAGTPAHCSQAVWSWSEDLISFRHF